MDHIPLVDISWMRKSQSKLLCTSVMLLLLVLKYVLTLFPHVNFLSTGEKGKLPIKLAAVDLEEDGRLWLQKTLPGKTVWFTPLKRNENLTCVISVKLVCFSCVFFYFKWIGIIIKLIT